MTTTQKLERELRAYLAPLQTDPRDDALPRGFTIPRGAIVERGLPLRSRIRTTRIYRIPAEVIERRVIVLPGGGEDRVRLDSMRRAFLAAPGQGTIPPAKVSMLPDGRLFVDDGRHRLLAALERGQDALVRIIGKTYATAAEGTEPIGASLARVLARS